MNAIVSQAPYIGAAAAPRRAVVVEATVAAVMAGVLYSLSPVTALTAVIVALMIRAAGRDLPAAERRWVTGILLIAVALRGIAIGVIAWRNDSHQHSFSTILGDAFYAMRMSLWIRNAYLEIPIKPLDYFEAFGIDYGHTSYHTLLAILQVFVGPAPYGIHVLSAALYLAGFVVLYRTARRSYGPIAALIGLIAVLFLPTLFLWSILPLKESVYFFCAAIVISTVASLRRIRSWAGAGTALALIAGALIGINSLRAGVLAIVAGGLLIGLAARIAVQRRLVLVIVLVAAPVAAAWALAQPAVRDQLLIVMRDSVLRHLGHVRTPGTSYKLVDVEYYRGDRRAEELTFEEGVEFLVRSVEAFVLIPKPWAPAGRSDVYMAPQQVAWYALALFAVVGTVAGLRREPVLTCLLAGNVIAGVIVIAPNSGNVGTLIRHRDMVVPFVVWLSGMGILATMTRCAAVRRRHALQQSR